MQLISTASSVALTAAVLLCGSCACSGDDDPDKGDATADTSTPTETSQTAETGATETATDTGRTKSEPCQAGADNICTCLDFQGATCSKQDLQMIVDECLAGNGYYEPVVLCYADFVIATSEDCESASKACDDLGSR